MPACMPACLPACLPACRGHKHEKTGGKKAFWSYTETWALAHGVRRFGGQLLYHYHFANLLARRENDVWA